MKRLKSNESETEEPCKKDFQALEAAVTLFDTQILTNPLIMAMIFDDFSYSTLLNCSLVSKAWNLTCRGILVDRFKTYLTLTQDTTPASLEELYDIISNTVPGHQHPVNGIRVVRYNFNPKNWCFSSEPYSGVIRRIMEKLEVKFVSFEMSYLRLSPANYHDVFKQLVIPHLATIEFLEILQLNGYGNLKTLSQQLKIGSCPNLKELNLGSSQDRLKCSTFKRILRACPNLKRLPAVMPYQLPTLRLANKLHLVSKVRFNFMILTESDLQKLRDYGALIKSVEIIQYNNQDKNLYEGEFISRLRPLFASNFQHRLEGLRIDLEPLIAILLQQTFPPLRNVKELICRGGHCWFPCLFKNRAIPFADFLPNLKSVTFCWTAKRSKWLRSLYAQNQDTFEDAPLSLFACKVPASLDSVTALTLSGFEDSDNLNLKYETLTKIMDLNAAFPCVTFLDIGIRISCLEDFLEWIVESWGDVLKTLILRGQRCRGFHSLLPDVLDDQFKELQWSKREPLPPGALYSGKLMNLRRLELEFRHRGEDSFILKEKVTLQDTFDLSGGQKVQVTVSGCRAKKRMTVFMSKESVFDAILALHPCPRNFEYTPMEEIIRTKSICTNICKRLPTPDLLNCSLVNQSWNAVARNVLYEHRSCIISLDPMGFYSDDIWDSKHFFVTHGKQKLINGIRLNIKFRTFNCENDIAWAQKLTDILGTTEFTHRSFKLLQVPGRDEICPLHETYSDACRSEVTSLRNAMLKLLKAFISKLKLDHVQTLVTTIEVFDELFRDGEGRLLVPNLKSIKFPYYEKLLEYPQVFKRVLEDLNCLERIEVAFSNKLLPLVSSVGRAHCVKHIQLYNVEEKEELRGTSVISEEEPKDVLELNDPRTAVGSLLKFAQEHHPRIESLTMDDLITFHQENEPLFGKIFQLLCTSSYETLKNIHLSLQFHYLISKVYTRPLVNLKKMEAWFENRDSDQLLLKIPFSQMYPNLEVVELRKHRLPISNETLEEELEWSPSSVEVRPCLSVNTIKIDFAWQRNISPEPINHLKPLNVEYISKVFPRVTKLLIRLTESSFLESSSIFIKILDSTWKSWPELKIVDIYTSRTLDAVSFEAWVLGISQAEWSHWKELLEQGLPPDFIKSMHYVPSTVSCFRSCKDLKELRIRGSIETLLFERYHISGNNWDTVFV